VKLQRERQLVNQLGRTRRFGPRHAGQLGVQYGLSALRAAIHAGQFVGSTRARGVDVTQADGPRTPRTRRTGRTYADT